MKTIFKYTTIERFRQRTGIAVEKASDSDVEDAILRSSERVNDYTGQRFLPVRELVYTDGGGDRLIYHPEVIPIIKLYGVTVNSSKTDSFVKGYLFSGVLTPDNYEITDSYFLAKILEKGSLKVIPKGVDNVEIDGLFGWLENVSDIKAQTLSELQSDSTTLVLSETKYFNVSDIVVLGNLATVTDHNLYLPWIEITAIDYDNNEITFEQISAPRSVFPIQVDTDATFFGRVPRAIVDATIEFAKNRALLATSRLDDTLIKKMKTDNFSWEKFTKDELGASPISFTGNSFVDSQLNRYMAPPSVLGI